MIFLVFFCFGFEKKVLCNPDGLEQCVVYIKCSLCSKTKNGDKFNKDEYKTEFILKIKKLLK